MTTPPIILTPSQQDAFDKMVAFIGDKSQRVFILTGYAGTGKTTITKRLIKKLNDLELTYRLCASTGRAAKILSDISGGEACTVHAMIYSYVGFNQNLEEAVKKAKAKEDPGQLYLVFGCAPIPKDKGRDVYIIDEASMIGDMAHVEVAQAQFGSGRLLSDLMAYDSGGKFIFIGDDCQLPPVSQPISPALTPQYFKDNFGITPQTASLTEIMRQSGGNDIVPQSAAIREEYDKAPREPYNNFPGARNDWHFLNWKGRRNIHILPSPDSLVEEYVSKIHGYKYDRTTLITMYNTRCQKLALRVRGMLGFTGVVSVNDLLLVTQNNISGLMNGDLVKVKAMHGTVTMAGLRFIEVSVENLASGAETRQYLIADILGGACTNLTPLQQRGLFIDFAIRMSRAGITQRDESFIINMRNDPYLNALRCVYGYCLTGHKAQGGEWDEVYLDMPRNITLNPTKSNYQWIYTAMTRAKERLHVANDFFIM